MLRDKRKQIIEYVKAHAPFIRDNAEALDIYEGNLKPYIDEILRTTLSPQYYEKIKGRILPINILQRYINKVAVTYNKPPNRKTEDAKGAEFVDFYTKELDINNSGMIADVYSHLFKGFAWEPYINKNGKPALRELSFDKFLVMSDSSVNPEEETIFIKFMGKKSTSEDSMLLFVYTDTEFDAFYMDEMEATEYLIDNEGLNPIGVIPFIYGKRQKNKLLPTIDSDMLAITKAIPTMLTDGAGAQMFQAFTIMYGIDVNTENLTMSPNAFWSIKSDPSSDKTPVVGTVKPEADTQKILDFVVSIFVIWLETKGIRVGSVGNVDAGNVASGISKIVDEMDAHKVVEKSMSWFEKDEKELWYKLAKIDQYWKLSGMYNDAPSFVGDLIVNVEFDKPEPMMSKGELIANIKDELALKTMTLEQAIKLLHPKYTDEEVEAVLMEAKTLNDLLNDKEDDELDTQRDNSTERV